MTVQQVITTFNNLINSNAINAVFTLADQIFILNSALNYIYNYHKWSWTIVNETITVNNSNIIETQYNILEVLKLNDGNNDYKRVNFFDGNNNQYQYRILANNRIELPQVVNGQFNIIYRRLPQRYNPTNEDLNKQVDLDVRLEGVLINTMIVKSLGIFMGEGAGGLLNFYKQEALEELNRLAQMDSYKEGVSYLRPKR